MLPLRFPTAQIPSSGRLYTVHLIRQKGNILAERLSFNTHPLKFHQLSAQTEKPTYAPLEK